MADQNDQSLTKKCDFDNGNYDYSRRNRQYQRLYVPGSGPLRKTDFPTSIPTGEGRDRDRDRDSYRYRDTDRERNQSRNRDYNNSYKRRTYPRSEQEYYNDKSVHKKFSFGSTYVNSNYQDKKRPYRDNKYNEKTPVDKSRYFDRNSKQNYQHKKRDNGPYQSSSAERHNSNFDKVNIPKNLPPRLQKLYQSSSHNYSYKNDSNVRDEQTVDDNVSQDTDVHAETNVDVAEEDTREDFHEVEKELVNLNLNLNDDNNDGDLIHDNNSDAETEHENNVGENGDSESDSGDDDSDSSDDSSGSSTDKSKDNPVEIFDWSEEIEKYERQMINAKNKLDEKTNVDDKKNDFKEPIIAPKDSIEPAVELFKKPEMHFETKHRNHDVVSNKSRRPSFQWSSSRESSRDRDRGRDRSRKSSLNESDNWRDEIRRNEERKKSLDLKIKSHAPGIIVLPQQTTGGSNVESHRPINKFDYHNRSYDKRKLYDPKNPKSNRPVYQQQQFQQNRLGQRPSNQGNMYAMEQKNVTNPEWYNEKTDSFKNCKHPNQIYDVVNTDMKITWILTNGSIFYDWDNLIMLRDILKSKLQFLLLEDLKFTQTENVELHFWKLLYYNIVEFLRHLLTKLPSNSDEKMHVKQYALHLIDDGLAYFSNLITVLETKYGFYLDDILATDLCLHKKRPGFVGLALNSVQKLCLFLGDLTRYKEQINETYQISKSKEWYMKAQHINPKNGKSYNQLAMLAYNEKRKFDAIYYYVRSLMSSNAIISARESLKSLFEETKRKYEVDEKQRLKDQNEKFKDTNRDVRFQNKSMIRREIWIHPEDGRRTSMLQTNEADYDDEQLRNLTGIDLLARFNVSFLHSHGKIFTKIGMDTFYETTIRMLNEFHLLLDRYLDEIPELRLLKLMALNMFAVENSQLKDYQHEDDYRSELQEKALILSLQMFNIMLNTCINQFDGDCDCKDALMSTALQQLLPVITIWCDWMLCHTSIWNPPLALSEYQVLGGTEDIWCRLATLMNILEKLDCDDSLVSKTQNEGFLPICLVEDSIFAGFTPLMYNVPEINYTHPDSNMIEAQMHLRVKKVLFFGTVFLCGLDPPVLKLLKFEDNHNEYKSVVCQSPTYENGPQLGQQYLIESISNADEVDSSCTNNGDLTTENHDVMNGINTNSDVRHLLHLKEQLEKQAKHELIVKEILDKSVVNVEIEVRPKFIVSDTNCFIDYLRELEHLCNSFHPNDFPYTLMVPIVVLNELEGLSRGKITSARLKNVSDDHLAKVTNAAKNALNFLRSKPPSVRCITTKGTTLTSLGFTAENDKSLKNSIERNDDRILTTCLNLCHQEQNHESQSAAFSENEPKKLIREVILLTEDRNLRIKALSRDLPVRELPDFMKWAGLG